MFFKYLKQLIFLLNLILNVKLYFFLNIIRENFKIIKIMTCDRKRMLIVSSLLPVYHYKMSVTWWKFDEK